MSQFKRAFTRFLIGIPRSIFPVLSVGSWTLIFRDGDVREVLERDKDFGLRQINYENIARHIGPFILGMDDGPEYQRDAGILRGIVRRDDVDRIKAFTRRTCAELTGNFKGEFNLVWEYTRRVPLLLCGDYFGVSGPNPEDMLRWNRSIFWDVFLDLKGKDEIRSAATQSAREMNAYLLNLLESNKKVMNSGGRLADNLFNRLLALQGTDQPHFDDKAICGNIAGVYMGAIEPISKAVVNALGQIYARPEILAKAKEAAAREDVDTIAGIAWEALRFHPNAPALLRYAERDQVIGGGDRKKRKIKGGKKLLVMTQSAMFDPRSVDHPKKFDPSRSFDKYLYFGFGLHTCYGNYINLIVIPEMIMALLKVAGLHPKGKVVSEGPFQDQWMFGV